MTKARRNDQKTMIISVALGFLAIVLGYWTRDWILRRGAPLHCDDGDRRMIDMREFAVHYSAYAFTFEAKLGVRSSLAGKLTPVQLSALNDAAQQVAEFRKLLVAGYNSCALSREQFVSSGLRVQALDGLSRQIDHLVGGPGLSSENRLKVTSLVDEYIRQAGRLGGQ